MTRSPSFIIPNGPTDLAARLWLGGEDLVARRPTAIVVGSWLTVKEQMADLYAQRLADRGFNAVTFDYTGFGQSGGELRQAELPARKIADLRAVVGWVASSTLVPSGGIGLVAVCASAQYGLAAVADGLPVDAFAAVAGWFHDTATVAPLYGGLDGVIERLRRADQAAARFLDAGEVVTVPAYDPADERAAMTMELDYYASPARGHIAAWRNEMAELSWRHWLTFDGLTPAAGVHTPTLLVHSDDAVLPANARLIADRVGGPVEVCWTTGTQIDFYDQPTQVDVAIDAVDTHLRTHLTVRS